MLGSFLKTNASNWQPPRLDGYTLLVHGHCHQKSLLSMSDEVSLLRATGAQVSVLDAGCCGMAGPFGFEKDKYEISRNLAERVLLPVARQATADTILVMNGFSCREQIKQDTDLRALHLAEVLAGERPFYGR
jgi:Fe-S oxidoreductase